MVRLKYALPPCHGLAVLSSLLVPKIVLRLLSKLARRSLDMGCLLPSQ